MRKNNVNYVTIISCIIVLLVIGLSVGWSSFNSSMQIESMALVRISADIRITGFNFVTGTNNGTSANENYSVNNVFGNATLPSSNSTVKYMVEVSNLELPSNVHMGIESISGLPSNLKIVSIDDYTLKSKICDDDNVNDCGTGAQKTFYITIGYKDNAYDANNVDYAINLDFVFKKVHDIIYTGFSNPPSSPITVMDGDTVTIQLGSDAQNISVISGGVTLTQNVNYTYNNSTKVLTFITPITDNIYIVNPSTYTITYVLNGGTQAQGQITTYSSQNPENLLNPTRQNYFFGGWYETSDFSSPIITSTSQLVGNATLYARWGSGIARIGNTYYNTLKDAVTAVPTNNTETTIYLLGDTSEHFTVNNGQNIVFDFQNNTLSNDGTFPVIETTGHIKFIRGTITSDTTQGIINVNTNGVLDVTGGSIIMTGTKQAVYNDGGTVNISGDAYLSSSSTIRAAVQNQANSTMTITGGTIVSTGFSGLVNNGTLTIGVKDGVANLTPVIRGNTYGINPAVNFNYYDGKIQGKTAGINNEATRINEIETDYYLEKTNEAVDNVVFKTVTQVKKYRVEFNPNGGTVSESERYVAAGGQIGNLPVPTQTDYVFDGWFTEASGGTEVIYSSLVNNNMIVYAHWTHNSQIVVAKIGNTGYNSLQAAITAAPNGVQTTITLERNTIENVTITSQKNLIFDFQSYKVTNDTHFSVITNEGTIRMISGNIYSTSPDASAVNNNGGTFTITGGNITATGKRQAIYNDGGTVYISGDCYLSAKAQVENSNKRGTVQNLANGTMYITGGTIVSTEVNGVALNNLGTTTIGTKDGNINTSTPVLQGVYTGINNTGTLNFYDGIIKATTDLVVGTIADEETNANEVNGTELINGTTYQTLTLGF